MCGWYVVSDGVKWYDCGEYVIQIIGHDGVQRIRLCMINK
jgi:hypothetical protein